MQSTPERHLYEYATIRFLPSVERGEFINVGLIMMCKRRRWIRVELACPRERIAALFPDADLPQLEAQLASFTDIAPAPLPTFWASGAALMVRTDLYLQLGGLDPEFFAHMEEIDLCWRMQLAGYRIATVTSATVNHLGGASLDASDPKKTYLNFRNNLLMMHKNLPRRVRSRRLFVRRLLDTAAFARFAALGQWRHAKAILSAHRDYRKMSKTLPTAADEAPDLLTTAPNRPLSILTARYLRRVTRYSDL